MMIFRSFLEFAAIVLVIVGFVYERKIAAFENKLFRAIGIHIRNYRRRKAHEAMLARQAVQSRAPAAEPEEEIAITVVSGKSTSHRVA